MPDRGWAFRACTIAPRTYSVVLALEPDCPGRERQLAGTCLVVRTNSGEEYYSCVMKSTVINTSKEMTAYSDFPPEPSMANFMHNTEMYRYLNSYADHYDLKKYIKFNHKVLNIERTSDYKKTGQWKVTYEDESATKSSEVFDGVLLCCGHHALPRMPAPWPGQDRFKGRIIHSHSYRDHKGFEDKVVVVVGVGNSGGDLAVELSRIAKQVYLVTRRGTWVLNRIFDYGEPFDLAMNRKYLNDARSLVPDWLVNTFVEQKLNKRFDHERYGLKPKHRIFSAHPTVNDELPNRIACGTVRIKPNISEFTENGVTFEDGSHLETVDEPVGSIMPISEMQARVFYENLFGHHKIPGSEEVDFITYMDELADLVGCRPNLKELLLSDPLLAFQVYFGPYVPYVYRLSGPHSWSGARQAIMTVDERVFKVMNSDRNEGLHFMCEVCDGDW
ncbi:Flavin-binding monooxygenase-like protein [Ancylostoma ceylanicum]|uniref:Flavin-containing monooxygenase n=1 Tax=Ancylostoma ceylanicum TaxID=53326 RepID=A0A0D6L5L3_9BILA|nr:Flavin-binding monooxygenase-like protein [Ancylostoma ceylanicum]